MCAILSVGPRETLGSETAHLHHAARRRGGGVAVRGQGAAGARPCPADRLPWGAKPIDIGPAPDRAIQGWSLGEWSYRGAKYRGRLFVGRGQHGTYAAAGSRTRPTRTRCDRHRWTATSA